VKSFLLASTLCTTILSVSPHAQDRPITTGYQICAAAIEQTPQTAYEPCKQYVDQRPLDDPKHAEFVQQWMAEYEKVLPYVRFLEGLTADPKAAWFVYGPDLQIELPATSQTEGAFPMELRRSFSNAEEEAMLVKAEAVYSSPSQMVKKVFRSIGYWASEPRQQEMAPIWGERGNDEIQQTEVVTARAVRYYYDLTLAVRQNPHLPSGFNVVQTNLKYDASIKHYDKYSHSKDHFENVYVANLDLKWSFTCGGLCGMGFTRNKLVVFNSQGDVIAMYLDAPENSESWVS
jgi:hypothetical protein